MGLETRGIDGYIPNPYEARELNLGRGGPRRRWRKPEHQRIVQKPRRPAGQAVYRRRKAIVEPVFGVLEQRDLRQFSDARLGEGGGGSHPGSDGVQFDPNVAHRRC